MPSHGYVVEPPRSQHPEKFQPLTFKIEKAIIILSEARIFGMFFQPRVRIRDVGKPGLMLAFRYGAPLNMTRGTAGGWFG
jgi:hypothetical protein